MATRSNKGNGLKTHYDKLIMVLMVLALIGSAGWMFTGGGGMGWEPEGGRVPPGDAAQDYDIKGLADEWTEHVSAAGFSFTNRLLTSELRKECVWTNEHPQAVLIPQNAEECPFCNKKQPKLDGGTDRDNDGIPDLVEMAHKSANLEPKRPEDAFWDCDQDGFTALEEYQWQRSQDPTREPGSYNFDDPTKHPPLLTRLRNYRIINRPLNFEFKRASEIQTGVYSFQVSIIDGRNNYKKIGDTVNGYKIEKYNPEKQELHIDGPVGALKLPRGERVAIPQRVAILVIVAQTGTPPFKEQVEIGSTFSVENEKFEVTGIEAEVVVAVGEKAGEVRIPQTNPDELQHLKDILAGKFPCGETSFAP